MPNITYLQLKVLDQERAVKELKRITAKLVSINEQSENFYLHSIDHRIGYEIKTLEDLTAARAIAKKVYPNWHDKLDNIWSSGYNHMAAWRDKDCPGFEIRLCTSIEDFPSDKLGVGDSCGFVKTTQDNYYWQCDVK